jgi:pimeloyl-ACP methyl ester carboxylesterase
MNHAPRICLGTALLLAACSFPTLAQSEAAHHPGHAGGSGLYFQYEGFVGAHGVMIYFLDLGHGAPLVIVHGGPGASHDYFLPYLLPLARHNHVSLLKKSAKQLFDLD